MLTQILCKRYLLFLERYSRLTCQQTRIITTCHCNSLLFTMNMKVMQIKLSSIWISLFQMENISNAKEQLPKVKGFIISKIIANILCRLSRIDQKNWLKQSKNEKERRNKLNLRLIKIGQQIQFIFYFIFRLVNNQVKVL